MVRRSTTAWIVQVEGESHAAGSEGLDSGVFFILLLLAMILAIGFWFLFVRGSRKAEASVQEEMDSADPP